MSIRRPSRGWIIAAALALVGAPFGINAALQAHAQPAAPVTIAAPAQQTVALATPPAASVASTPVPTGRTLEAAIDAYMQSNTEVNTYTTQDEQIVGDVARVLVVPPADVTDPAFVFARKGADGWEAIGIGTYFPEDFYRSEDIPVELWVQ